jgi:hypothetical protein
VSRRHRLLALALAAAAAGCAVRRPIGLADRPPLPPGATLLTYAGGGASGLYRPDGRPCPRAAAEPRLGIVGWPPPKDEELVCLQDTHDHGATPAAMELRWRGVVAEDGSYALLARGLTLDAWGRVVARGGPYGEYIARAWFELVARAPSCTARHTLPLARAAVSAVWIRQAAFGGWIEVPDLELTGCRAGEVLEVRVRLLGEVNRGRLEVESFGVVAHRADELQDTLALRRRLEPGPAISTPP